MIRRIHIVALAVATLWFVVIAPGHQRGVLTLPGPDAAVACCPLSAADAGLAADPTADPDEPRPAPPCHDPAQGCAICQLITTLGAPTHLDLTPPGLGLLPWHAAAACTPRPRSPMRRTFDARPPPLSLPS